MPRSYYLLSLIGLILLGVGCANSNAPVSDKPTSTSVSSTTFITAPSFDWSRVSTDIVTLSNGMVVKSCGGSGPIVCVYQNGTPVGQMELLTYEKGKEPQTLNARIEDYYKNISEDRRTICPKGFLIETTPPQSVIIAGSEGKKARLEVFDMHKKSVERNMLYMTEQHGKIFVFNVAGYAEGSCISPEVDYTTIHNLNNGVEQALEAVVKTSKLPL